MKTFTVALVLLGTLFSEYVDANHEECKEDMMKFKQAVSEELDDDKYECTKKYELAKYKCADEENEEKHRAMHAEFKAWMKGLDEPTQKDVMKCLLDVSETAYQNVKENLTEECNKKLKEAREKVEKMLSGHEESE